MNIKLDTPRAGSISYNRPFPRKKTGLLSYPMMILSAVQELNEASGSTIAAIQDFVNGRYSVDSNSGSLRKSIKRVLDDKHLTLCRGSMTNKAYRLGPVTYAVPLKGGARLAEKLGRTPKRPRKPPAASLPKNNKTKSSAGPLLSHGSRNSTVDDDSTTDKETILSSPDKTSNTKILSYYDNCIRQSDLMSLQDENWLSDVIIG